MLTAQIHEQRRQKDDEFFKHSNLQTHEQIQQSLPSPPLSILSFRTTRRVGIRYSSTSRLVRVGRSLDMQTAQSTNCSTYQEPLPYQSSSLWGIKCIHLLSGRDLGGNVAPYEFKRKIFNSNSRKIAFSWIDS